jgi:hypothetical protein
MRQRSVAYHLLARDEFVQSEKRVLCGAFLLILAVIGAAILVVLSLPPSGILGPEPEHLMPVALAAGDLERDAPKQSFATSGPEFSYAYAPPIPQEVQTVRGSNAGTGVASSKRVHTHQGIVMAKLASHRKRAHAILAHTGERHRRAAVASRGHVGGLGRNVMQGTIPTAGVSGGWG